MGAGGKAEARPRRQELAIGGTMEITLYYAPITCALAPYVTLTEAGAKFQVRPLNFKTGEHTSPET
jgi:hypothetical protein